MAEEPQPPPPNDLLRMIMEAQVAGFKETLSRAMDQRTYVGGKRVTQQQVPKLRKSAATMIPA